MTQSPPGPDNGNPANWGGVLQYVLPADGGDLAPLGGIDAGLLHDPSALTYRASTSELFVANRHGNNSADGTAGSISRFKYSSSSRNFTPNGTITGNGLSGVHQLAFNPINGELFASNLSTGVSRFVFVDGGAVANGTLGGGVTRGVLVSRNGQRLYVTTAGNIIRQFELDGGAELTAVTLPGAPVLHYLSSYGDTVYAAGYSNGMVFRLHQADDGTLSLTDSFTASSPLSVVVDPTGLELYTSGHKTSDVIERFWLDGGAWMPKQTYSTTFSLGGIELLP